MDKLREREIIIEKIEQERLEHSELRAELEEEKNIVADNIENNEDETSIIFSRLNTPPISLSDMLSNNSNHGEDIVEVTGEDATEEFLVINHT